MSQVLDCDVAWRSRQSVVPTLVEARCERVGRCRRRDSDHRDGDTCWAGIGMPIKQRQHHRCPWIANDDWPQEYALVAGDGVCT